MAIKKREPIVVRATTFKGVGKSTSQREYAVQLLVGQNGSGKTTDIINTVKYYIAQQKRRKEDWKVWIFTSTPDEFKKFNPENRKTRIDFKNQVFISSNIKLLKNSWHIFKDGLVVLDNEFAISVRNDSDVSFLPRSKRIDIILSYGSLLDIDYKAIANARYLKMFTLSDIPVSVRQRDKLNDRFPNLPLLDIAQHITNSIRDRYYYNCDNLKKRKHVYDRYTLVDIQNNKVVCADSEFFYACQSVANYGIPKTVDGLFVMGNRLSRYSKYFEPK